MKERPILFSAPMVRALLAGTKTQTRRALRVQPPVETQSFCTYHHPDPRPHHYAVDGGSLLDFAVPCPYGAPGDRLYVRETWQHEYHPEAYRDGALLFYRADYLNDPHGPDGEKSPEGRYRSWRPAIHMPRDASRILLELTDVRVERLNSISESDAMAEGIRRHAIVDHWFNVPGVSGAGTTARAAYALLWNSINGKGSWNTNPWVWAVSFRVIKGGQP